MINLDDELFGLEPLNHAAWAHFSMDVDAEGLRDHLLSSREGVRDSEPIEMFRQYLHRKFNACRLAYDRTIDMDLRGLDIERLIQNAPSSLVIEPLSEAVRSEMLGLEGPSYYIKAPNIEGTELGKWLDDYAEAVAEEPISSLDVESGSPYEPPAAYFAESRKIRINKDRPFISKILANSRNQAPAGLFSSSEIITDALLRHLGVSSQTTIELFELRDRVLRVLADDYAPDAFEVLRHLEIANDDETAMEIAVGEGFSVLGFEYEKRGGNDGGPDGVLDARLGRQGSTMADYKIVYDAKTTAQPSVPAEKVDFTALWDFKLQ